MADKVTMKISAEAAAYVGKDAAKGAKLKAARGEVTLPAGDLGTVLFFLAHDPDPEVRTNAVQTLRALPEALVGTIVASPEVHPRFLEILARLHFGNPALGAKISSHPGVSAETLAFLAEKGVGGAVEALEKVLLKSPGQDGGETETGEESSGEKQPEEELAEIDEESEEFKSKFQMCQKMGISEKIKMALTGDKEWRSILLKDSNKLVSAGVMKNPRITDPEILTIAKSTAVTEEVMRLICVNKDWVKIYAIRKALVENHKTPLPFALRQLATLSDKDVAALSKSKNVSSVISGQARRLIVNKQEKRK